MVDQRAKSRTIFLSPFAYLLYFESFQNGPTLVARLKEQLCHTAYESICYV